MNIRLCVFCVVLACGLAADLGMTAGKEAPDLAVRNMSGEAVKLSAYKQKKNVVLLTAPEKVTATDWGNASRRLTALDTVVLFNEGPAATTLIDQAGMVRRVESGRALNGAELEGFVAVWQSGKAAFGAYCGPCHGADGGDVWCDPNPLIGVSQRLSEQQIRDALHMYPINGKIMIRGQMYEPADIEAIIVFLRGL